MKLVRRLLLAALLVPITSSPLGAEPKKVLKTAPARASAPSHIGMVRVPAGEFFMGCNSQIDSECYEDEKPGRTVYLDQFWIDRTEVTNADYCSCVRAGRCAESYRGRAPDSETQAIVWAQGDCRVCSCTASSKGEGNVPVTGVVWSQAKVFCEWAGKRLPTEAEWEKAARGTDGRKYSWGNEDLTKTSLIANLKYYRETSNYDIYHDAKTTAPVRSFPEGSSPFGALDMIGNVAEWVADVYDRRAYTRLPSRNPRAEAGSTWRVVRGGSYYNQASWYDDGNAHARCSFRESEDPTTQNLLTGFRCAQ